MRQYTYDVIVVGTGAAGYNAACRIRRLSDRSVAIVTEGIDCGTSRNTGSDKQTYYKLSLCGSDGDSVREMADTLYSGGGVMGEHALCEAAYSTRCFILLASISRPSFSKKDIRFPRSRYICCTAVFIRSFVVTNILAGYIVTSPRESNRWPLAGSIICIDSISLSKNVIR